MKKISFIKNMMMTSAVALSLFSNSVIANPSDADVEAYLKGLSVFSLTTPEDRAVYTTFSDEKWEGFKKLAHDLRINRVFRSERLAVLAALATLPDEKLNDAFFNQLVRFARYMDRGRFVKDTICLINALGHVPEKNYAPLESRLRELTKNSLVRINDKDVITVIEALASCPPESYDKLFACIRSLSPELIRITEYQKFIVDILKTLVRIDAKVWLSPVFLTRVKRQVTNHETLSIINAINLVVTLGKNCVEGENFLYSHNCISDVEIAKIISNVPAHMYHQWGTSVSDFLGDAKNDFFSHTFRCVSIAGIDQFQSYINQLKKVYKFEQTRQGIYSIIPELSGALSRLAVRTPAQFSQFQACVNRFITLGITVETVCTLLRAISTSPEDFDILKLQARIKTFIGAHPDTAGLKDDDASAGPIPPLSADLLLPEEYPGHRDFVLGRFKSDENIETHRLLMEIPENHMARFDQLMHSVLNIDEMNERQRETVWRSIRKIPSEHLFNTLPVLLTDILDCNTKPGDLKYIEPEERAEIVQSVSAFVPHLKWPIMSGHSQRDRFLILHKTDVKAVNSYFRKVITVWKIGYNSNWRYWFDDIYNRILKNPHEDLYPVFMEVLRGMRTQGRQISQATGERDLFSGDFGQRVLQSLPIVYNCHSSEFLPHLRICMNAAKKER